MNPAGALYRYADTVGDGSGTANASGNYSAAGGESFHVQPEDGETFQLIRLIWFMDCGSGNINAGNYGEGAVLTNGISIVVSNNTEVLLDLTAGLPIKTNADWGRVCYDVARRDWAVGNDFMGARWTLEKDLGQPLLIRGSLAEKLEIFVHDDFTSRCDSQFFAVRGHRSRFNDPALALLTSASQGESVQP